MQIYKRQFLFFLISLWICMSIFNVFYNSIKSVSEIKNWAFLSDGQKRHKIFGDVYDFLIFVKAHTGEKDKILLFSKDVKTFYLSKYYLYPRIVETTDNEAELRRFEKNQQYQYIGIYDKKFKFDKYQFVASTSSQTSVNYSLYKIK